MRNRNQPILALDPGTRDLGYGVLQKGRLLTSGVLPLRHLPASRKLPAIQEAVVRMIRAYRPRTLVLEHIPKRPLDALAGLPALGRSLRRLAARHRLIVASYSARTVRQTIVGDGWAAKRDVARTLSRLFPELRVHLTQDRKWKLAYWGNMYDAVATGLHHQIITQPPSRSRDSG